MDALNRLSDAEYMPHPTEVRRAADACLRLAAASEAVVAAALAIDGDAAHVKVPRELIGALRAALNHGQRE